MLNLMSQILTRDVLHLLDAQKFPDREAFEALLVKADQELERRTLQANRLRQRMGKLIDLLPGLTLSGEQLPLDYEKDVCDE
jgi:hypothetical protein